MISTRPYLSVAVTARNDDHGGNLRARMQAFVSSFLKQCKRHQVPAELIFVEWNPVADRPKLIDALHWPDSGGFCDVRILEVPAELHQRYRHWQAMPLYQMIAKNAGIRRARGEFVLATNIDVIFSDELMEFIAQRKLDPARMYRVDRWDVLSDVPVDAPVEEQLAYCESHVIRVNMRNGTFRRASDGSITLEQDDMAPPDGPIRMGPGWFQREMSGDEPFRWVDNDAELTLVGGAGKFLILDVEPGPGVALGSLLLELREPSGKLLKAIRVKRRSVVSLPLPAGGADRLRVKLCAHNGGLKIRSDLRTLNFRVFRCFLENAPRATDAPPTVRRVESLRTRLGRAWKLGRAILRGDPDVQIRLPLSRERLAKLQLRQDSGGVSFSARALRSGRDGEEILPPGARAIWVSGFYSIEYFAGETFRWMRGQSAIVWMIPRNCAGAIGLHVEPGPAIGFKACEVEVQDEWGRSLGVFPVHGRSVIRIPVKPDTGALITNLTVRGGGSPKRTQGDSREMALRLLDCTWLSENLGEEEYRGSSWIEASPGIWCGEGCARVEKQPGAGLPALSGAELILRAPDGQEWTLGFEVAPAAESGSVHLEIQEIGGASLLTQQIDAVQEIHIGRKMTGGGYYALRFLDSAPDAEDPEQAFLLIRSAFWEDREGVRTRFKLQTPALEGAVQLHTNACGDFTLLSRERWMDLRGYPEFDMFSMNIDSVFCWMAHHGGAREEVLADPMRIYHIEHGTGSGWTPEGERKLFERIAAKGIGWLDYNDVLDWARVMNRFDSPMIFNRENWGLANEDLRETTPGTVAAAQ